MTRLLLRADRLIDGSGGKPLEKGAVLVHGERILAVGRREDIGTPDGARIVEAASGATLMPGLADVHVHLAYSGIPHKKAFRSELIEMSYAGIALRAAGYAKACLAMGFTALRDMHAPGGTIIDLAASIDRGETQGPRI